MTWNQQQEEADAEEQIDRCVTFSDHVALVVSERKRAFEAWQKAQQLQAELDKLKAAHAWIKTSERMPDAADGSCCDVLAIIDGTAIVLNYTPDDSVHPWADEFSNIYRADEVTHWQPLPESPK